MVVQIGERPFRREHYKLVLFVIWVHKDKFYKYFLLFFAVNQEHEIRAHFNFKVSWDKADVSIRVILNERNKLLILLKLKYERVEI